MKILYLIRGAPGSGKSSLALAIIAEWDGVMHEADDFYYDEDGAYKWDPSKISEAHAECQAGVEVSMSFGVPCIVVSNTTVTKKHCKPYYDLADKYGYKVQEIVMMNVPFDNIHGVPKEVVEQKHKALMEDLERNPYAH